MKGIAIVLPPQIIHPYKLLLLNIYCVFKSGTLPRYKGLLQVNWDIAVGGVLFGYSPPPANQ